MPRTLLNLALFGTGSFAVLCALVMVPAGFWTSLWTLGAAVLAFIMTMLAAAMPWLRAKCRGEDAKGKWTNGSPLVSTIAGCLFLLCIVLLGLQPLGISIPSGRGPGRFKRPQMEAIVAHVRTLGLKPGDEQFYILHDFSKPETLQPASEYKPGHRVWGAVSKAGKLRVVIETNDSGHAGHYGFAWTEEWVEAQPFEGDSRWHSIDVPTLYIVTPDMRIDDHWWKCLNNLD